MNYGEAIHDLRKSKTKQTQAQFAESVGITQTYLSQIENGQKTPSTQLLEAIASHVDIPMPILFWNCLSEADVKPKLLETYRSVKPSIDALIKTFFEA